MLLRHPGVGGKSQYRKLSCPSGFSHFIDACLKISTLPTPVDYETAEKTCQDDGSQLLKVQSFFLNAGLKSYLLNVSSSSSLWVGKFSDLQGKPVDVNGVWADGGVDAEEDCIIADQGDAFLWKRVPCSDTATFICEAKPPSCPVGYSWIPQAGESSCFKMHSRTETEDANSVKWSSIMTATKMCLAEGTRLATPATVQQVEALSDFFKILKKRSFGGKATDDFNVWLGIQYFHQYPTRPASCSTCATSPDWYSTFLSPWYSSNVRGDSIPGSIFNDNTPCYTYSTIKTYRGSNCMHDAATHGHEGKTLALCEYKGCSSSSGTCVFPFRHGGRLYNTCIRIGTEDGVPWCSTEVDDKGVHIEGKEMTCPSECAVSDCPVGFLKHLKTCIQESASTQADAPSSVLKAEQKCLDQGARLYQPRSSRTLDALKAKTPILYYGYSSTVTGIHRWARAGGADQDIAIGLTMNSPAEAPTLVYNDGSNVPLGLISTSLNWAATFPTKM